MRRALILVAVACGTPATAWADGGAVRVSQQRGGYRVTVFTDPTPLHAGLVDVSVLVQDAKTGRPRTDLPALVRATQGTAWVEVPATVEGATNQLFRAAVVELPYEGRWRFEVTVEGVEPVAFEAEVAGPPPAWVAYAPWIAWPALPIALFAIHYWLMCRRGSGTAGSRYLG